MLFHVSWDFIDTTEDGARRSLNVLAGWQPPAGAEFKGFYGFADGRGGVAIIEADSVATLTRTTAPWTPWLRFRTRRSTFRIFRRGSRVPGLDRLARRERARAPTSRTPPYTEPRGAAVDRPAEWAMDRGSLFPLSGLFSGDAADPA